jgi:hypothetical protein
VLARASRTGIALGRIGKSGHDFIEVLDVRNLCALPEGRFLFSTYSAGWGIASLKGDATVLGRPTRMSWAHFEHTYLSADATVFTVPIEVGFTFKDIDGKAGRFNLADRQWEDSTDGNFTGLGGGDNRIYFGNKIFVEAQ